MAREKGRQGKFKKENKEKQKKKGSVLKLKGEDLQWLASNTKFDKSRIEEWHTVGFSISSL